MRWMRPLHLIGLHFMSIVLHERTPQTAPREHGLLSDSPGGSRALSTFVHALSKLAISKLVAFPKHSVYGKNTLASLPPQLIGKHVINGVSGCGIGGRNPRKHCSTNAVSGPFFSEKAREAFHFTPHRSKVDLVGWESPML